MFKSLAAWFAAIDAKLKLWGTEVTEDVVADWMKLVVRLETIEDKADDELATIAGELEVLMQRRAAATAAKIKAHATAASISAVVNPSTPPSPVPAATAASPGASSPGVGAAASS